MIAQMHLGPHPVAALLWVAGRSIPWPVAQQAGGQDKLAAPRLCLPPPSTAFPAGASRSSKP